MQMGSFIYIVNYSTYKYVNKLEYLALLITGKWVCSECSEQGINDEDLDENSEKKETESPIISGTNVM
jgi:hypothetical protein